MFITRKELRIKEKPEKGLDIPDISRAEWKNHETQINTVLVKKLTSYKCFIPCLCNFTS